MISIVLIISKSFVLHCNISYVLPINQQPALIVVATIVNTLFCVIIKILQKQFDGECKLICYGVYACIVAPAYACRPRAGVQRAHRLSRFYPDFPAGIEARARAVV